MDNTGAVLDFTLALFDCSNFNDVTKTRASLPAASAYTIPDNSRDFTCLLQRWKIELQENKQILKMA